MRIGNVSGRGWTMTWAGCQHVNMSTCTSHEVSHPELRDDCEAGARPPEGKPEVSVLGHGDSPPLTILVDLDAVLSNCGPAPVCQHSLQYSD